MHRPRLTRTVLDGLAALGNFYADTATPSNTDHLTRSEVADLRRASTWLCDYRLWLNTRPRALPPKA